jgi:hypothetical protein
MQDHMVSRHDLFWWHNACLSANRCMEGPSYCLVEHTFIVHQLDRRSSYTQTVFPVIPSCSYRLCTCDKLNHLHLGKYTGVVCTLKHLKYALHKPFDQTCDPIPDHCFPTMSVYGGGGAGTQQYSRTAGRVGKDRSSLKQCSKYACNVWFHSH